MARKFEPMDLIRLVVGIVFLSEGILKFFRPEDLGVGRFARIGLPLPSLLAPIVGAVEIIGGLSLLLNLAPGLAAVALLGVISTALLTTKLPVLLGRPLGPFTLMKAPFYGVLGFLHESRADLSMFTGTLALIWRQGVRRKGR
jgi:putative oxidoreductase